MKTATETLTVPREAIEEAIVTLLTITEMDIMRNYNTSPTPLSEPAEGAADKLFRAAFGRPIFVGDDDEYDPAYESLQKRAEEAAPRLLWNVVREEALGAEAERLVSKHYLALREAAGDA